MDETFEDYSERYVEIWNDWQRDRECLIANMEAIEQQNAELKEQSSRLAAEAVRQAQQNADLCVKNAELLDVVQELESAVLAAHNLIEVEQFCAAEITIKRANDGIWERREAIAKAGGEI